MFNVGTGELVLIMVLALIVLGPDKLPTAARQAGRYLAEFRRISNGFQQEFRDAVDSAVGDDLRRGTDSFRDITAGFSDTFRMPDLAVRDVVAPPPADELELYDEPPKVELGKPEPPGDVRVDGPSGSFS